MPDPLHIRLGITPRGLTRDDSAEYCGIDPATFDNWRHSGKLPGPIPGTKRWDRKALDLALDRLSSIETEPQSRGDFANVGKAASAIRR